MSGQFAKNTPKLIPDKYLSWLFSLVGGSALVLTWSILDQSKQPVPAGSQPGVAGAGGYSDGTYRASADVPWGMMGIEVTVSGGRWTAIKTPSVPNSPPSYYAVPYLVQQGLAAQSDQIDGVSGATYTSGAFRDDLAQIVRLSKK